MKLKNLLTTVLLLLGVSSASSAIESGYYRVKSYNSKYLTENTSNHTMVCSDLMSDNYSQVWYITLVDESYVRIKNVLTDKYIYGLNGNQFYTSDSFANFSVNEDNGVYTFHLGNDYLGLHCDNNNNVVCYYISEAKSKWTLETVTVDPDELTAQKNAIIEASTTDLLKVFTSTACTELKNGYTESDLAALPASTQSVAAKIKNNTWTTYAGWDKTEKTFRIADYKAYSSHERWTNILGLGYSFGCLTNPTGITVAAGDYIQVYVGAIPSGQAVQLEVAGDYQAAGATYSLKQGMNVLLMASSGNCFVRYEVDNTTSGSAPYTNINSYAPVTVHIEGGTVNGYFDLTGGDENDDWAQLKAHLLTGSCVELKTSNLLFHMQASLVKDACPTNMVELLGEWDKILDMEHSLMGLEAFDGYWNNLLSVTDMSGQDYMHATTYGTYYADYTISSVMSYEELFSGGAIWGPAHENGHIFQKYINMVGQTEVSNNLFSNVAVYNNGHLTSRASLISTTFENMANNVFWNDRGIWERTHLYFQLYQFFHILGNDPDFYPELFKALRSDPMVHTGGIFTSATDDYLKFYKKCCSVSGYDLTEFFQAYGFFVIPSLTSYTLSEVTKDAYQVGDYGTYYLTVTQDEIDAVKAEVAAMNLPKANIIFIEDRITAPDATYEGATAGTKKTAFSDEFPIGQAGETGQYTTFGATPSAYKYNVIDNRVIMAGSGAVGFKVYDSAGNLRGLYNTYRFTLPDGIGTGYTVKAAAGNGTDAAATFDATLGTIVSDVTDTKSATAAVTAGAQITAESQLVSGQLYLIYYVGNGDSAYMKDTGTAYTGKSENNATQNAVYRFTDNGDGTWKIQNYATGKYWGTPTENANKYMGSDTPGAWTLNFQANNYIAPSCNGHSLNRSGSNIHPWSTGTANVNQLKIEAVTYSIESLPDFTDKDISVSVEAAATLQTGQWYVMFDRGANHGYLYENNANKLYNTATVPSGSATDNAKYLVRVVGWENEYYLQTGLGNFFGNIEHSKNVPTTATADEAITLKKIKDTDGHYYLASAFGTILDANSLELGDATVVGWGDSAPTTTGGNNDWAFFPVEIVESDPANQPINTLTPLSAAPTGEGWYALIIKSGTYADYAVYAPENEIAYQTDRNYALTFDNSQPTISNTAYYTRIVKTDNGYSWQLPNGRYLYNNASNFFPTSTAEIVENVGITYSSNGMQFSHGGRNAIAYYLGSKYFIGETVNTGSYFDVYPINLDDAGLTAWQVTIAGTGSETITCNTTGVSGLQTVYNNGFFFLPKETTPQAADFAINGSDEEGWNFSVNSTDKTILAYTPTSINLTTDKVAVIQGNQTTGKGNTMQALLRIKITPPASVTPTSVSITLTGDDLLDKVAVYTTAIDEIRAAGANPVKIGEATVTNAAVTITTSDATALQSGRPAYLWITADVKSDATELEVIDAAITSLTYNNVLSASQTLDLTSVGNPDGAMKIYKIQTYPWTASQSKAQYYRIPTIISTADGGIVAFTDDRFDNPEDLGKPASGHKIDVVMRKSMDNGLTWDAAKVIAEGDGTSVAGYGYGDIAVARTLSGKLIGLLAAGKAGYASGMLHMGYIESTDNGATWSPVTDIFSDINKNGLELQSAFTTAGKGVTFDNGRVAFAMNGKVSGTTNEYVIYSDDEGATWNISPTAAFTGADESKLEIMNDNSLLMSIRRGGWNSMANRGYNRTTGDASGEGIDSWGTQGIWGDETNANGCNADILYYNRSTENNTRPDVIFHTLTKDYNVHRKDLRLYMSFDQGATWKEAFQLQPGYVAYSSMQKLANGDLAIIFEDGSIGAQDKQDCFAINYLVLSSETISAKIDELYTEVFTVKIVKGTTGYNYYGNYPGGWVSSWSSNANSGTAGLKMEAESAILNSYSSWGGYYNICIRPTTANTDYTVTLTAPDGFIIKDYSMLARLGSSGLGQYAVLTTDKGNTFKPTASAHTQFTESGIYAKTTSFTISSTQAGKDFNVADFIVTLAPEYPINLSAFNGKSYATLYLPFGITLPRQVTAYKISVQGEWARPTSMGQELPANTPALLVSDAGATSTTATVNESASADTENNALHGVLKATSGADLNGYVLNIVDSKLGFYKLDDGGTLAANRAYLPADIVGSVKGFILNWDELPVGIGLTPMNETESSKFKVQSSKVYNLAGQRIDNSQLKRGIYIVNGKKILVK